MTESKLVMSFTISASHEGECPGTGQATFVKDVKKAVKDRVREESSDEDLDVDIDILVNRFRYEDNMDNIRERLIQKISSADPDELEEMNNMIGENNV